MSRSKDSFTQWMEQRKNKSNNSDDEIKADEDWSNSIANWKSNVASQLHSYSSVLPDASTGPLSAEYRQRVEYAIYMILLACLFGALAIFVGLPTIAVRPSKFVICSTLCSLSVAGSIIILKKPSVFLSEMIGAMWGLVSSGNSNENGSPSSITVIPLALLILTNLFTIYITVFYHNYVYTLLASGLQCVAIGYYLLSYIPGGTRSLSMLMSSVYYLVLKPLFAAGMNCGYYCTSCTYSLIFPSETPAQSSWF